MPTSYWSTHNPGQRLYAFQQPLCWGTSKDVTDQAAMYSGPTHSPLVLIRRKTRIRISFDILNLTWKCIAKYIFFYFLHGLPPQKSETKSIWLHLFLHWLPTGPRIILIAENALLFAKGKIASNGQVEACLVAVTYAAIQVYFVPVRHTC